MKLACLRCKQKKLRCNRLEPCDKCIAANADCTTAERKQRVSIKARENHVVTSLNQRIGVLERALQSSLQVPATATITVAPPERSSATESTPTSTGSLLDTVNDGTSAKKPQTSVASEEWIGKELRELRNFSVGHLNDRGDLQADSPVVQALTELDGALTDLGTMHDAIDGEEPKALLSREEARQSVAGEFAQLAVVMAAFESLQGEFFTSMLDADFMISLADVINSPLVRIEPAARLIYHNLVFHGSVIGESKRQITARGLYLQCLQAVPAWQANATGTILDLISATLMTLTTAMSFDYNLAGKFHIQACNFTKHLNLHRLDALVAVGIKAKDSHGQRLGVWGLVLTDLFFRFFAGQKSALSEDVTLASVGVLGPTELVGKRPRAARTIVNTIWGRVIFIAKEFFEYHDRVKKLEGGRLAADFQNKVDELCDEIEEMIEDWHLTYLMKAKQKPLESWMIADTIIGSLNILLQMDKVRLANEPLVSERSLRASRQILDTTINFDETLRTGHKHNGLLYMYCIAFYPFRACFSLYYHILLSNNPDDYSEDVQRLEKIGNVTMTAAQMRFEWIPIAKAILSLNQVVRHIRQNQESYPKTQWTSGWPIHAASTSGADMLSSAAITSTDNALSMPMESDDLAQWSPDLGDIRFMTAEDFQQAAAQPDFRPVEYMQAIEDQLFVGKNWNYGV